MKIVCISDTHGQHRLLDMPTDGDILIHAGDYTHFGKQPEAVDFNLWLGTLPYKHKIVVQGNHETNAMWKNEADSVLSNANLLRNDPIEIQGILIYGTEFYWKTSGKNRKYDLIPDNTDILIAHNPPKGYGDLNNGCASLTETIEKIKPKLVVNGHIHDGRGVGYGKGPLLNTVFVNAANAGDRHRVTKNPIVVQF